jgi:hypothetical protein
LDGVGWIRQKSEIDPPLNGAGLLFLVLLNLGILVLFASPLVADPSSPGPALLSLLVLYRLAGFRGDVLTPGTNGGEPLQWTCCRRERVPAEAAIASVGLDTAYKHGKLHILAG